MSRSARRLVVLGAVLATALCTPASLVAQGSTQVSLFSYGGKASPTTVVQIPARVAGHLVIRFHGDPATDCAVRGLCGYAGTIVWTPPSGGSLAIFTTGGPRRRHYDVSLSLDAPNGIPGNTGGRTDAAVVRTLPAQSGTVGPGGNCADATSTASSILLAVRRGRVRFSLTAANPSPLQTRCAGPVIADVASALAAPAPTLRSTLRGRMSLDLAGQNTFASHGLAGSVDSTLTIRLGRPHRSQSSASSPPLLRAREVEVQYRARIGGTLSAVVRGDADQALCDPLDACGLNGTLSVIPATNSVTAQLQAVGPAGRPKRDFLTALGLGSAGRAGGITVFGSVAWNHGGLAIADLVQGSFTCHDVVGWGGGTVVLTAVHRRLAARYLASGGFAAGELRTRCPGPFGPPELGVGIAPLSILSRRVARLPLDRPQAFFEDGYSVTSIPHLTLTLTRRRLRSFLVRLPQGAL